MSRPCRTLFEQARTWALPAAWREAEPRIRADAEHLEHLLRTPNPPAIYGVNTLVGHLDDHRLAAGELDHFQEELLHNHALGSAPYYDDLEAACLGYVRVHFFTLGGSAITPELFRQTCGAVTDPEFRPRVPHSCSYSCGDVIPAAHWALDLLHFLRLRGPYRLRRKEGLALINGCFIHVGLALARLGELQAVWLAWLLGSRLNAWLCRANPSNCTPLLAADAADPLVPLAALVGSETRGQPPRRETRQDPVSMRAFPQVADALAGALAAYLDALDRTLTRRSDNPLVLAESPETLSQASFLAPRVTLATGQLIEALLLAMWTTERRLHHLLSGQVPGVPLNGSRSEDELGFIQVPKLATALLEEARLLAGRRSFASGSSTSYGIEDLWTFGVPTLEVLGAVLQRLVRVEALEIVTAAACLEQFFPQEQRFREVTSLVASGEPLNRRFEQMRALILEGRLPFDSAVLPFRS